MQIVSLSSSPFVAVFFRHTFSHLFLPRTRAPDSIRRSFSLVLEFLPPDLGNRAARREPEVLLAVRTSRRYVRSAAVVGSRISLSARRPRRTFCLFVAFVLRNDIRSSGAVAPRDSVSRFINSICRCIGSRSFLDRYKVRTGVYSIDR